MRETKVVITSVLISLFLLASMTGVVFASPENWIEETRFTGSGQINQTETFNCVHVEWRIRWSYSPNPNFELKLPLMFHLRVWEVGGELVDFFIASSQTSGTLNYNRTGSVYLYIDEMYVENYTVIVEQNINSISEFNSMAPFLVTGLIAPLWCLKVIDEKTKLR